MSNSRRDRHKWKRKERRRTGQSDPAKIKKHRARVIERIRIKKEKEAKEVKG